MPRYRMPSGVIVDAEDDTAAAVPGLVALDLDDAPDGNEAPPADLQRWLDAEAAFTQQGAGVLTTAGLAAGGSTDGHAPAGAAGRRESGARGKGQPQAGKPAVDN